MMRDAIGLPLCVRVDRLEALFQETRFAPARPELDPGPALDHLVRRAEFRKLGRGTPLRVYLASEPVTAELRSIAENAVRTYCIRRAQESRATVRAIRSAGQRTMVLALCLMAAAMSASVALTHFEPLPAVYNELFSEAFVIAGWVILWRPLELLLYEWITPWRDAMDYEWLAERPVELLADDGSGGAPSHAAARPIKVATGHRP